MKSRLKRNHRSNADRPADALDPIDGVRRAREQRQIYTPTYDPPRRGNVAEQRSFEIGRRHDWDVEVDSRESPRREHTYSDFQEEQARRNREWAVHEAHSREQQAAEAEQAERTSRAMGSAALQARWSVGVRAQMPPAVRQLDDAGHERAFRSATIRAGNRYAQAAVIGLRREADALRRADEVEESIVHEEQQGAAQLHPPVDEARQAAHETCFDEDQPAEHEVLHAGHEVQHTEHERRSNETEPAEPEIRIRRWTIRRQQTLRNLRQADAQEAAVGILQGLDSRPNEVAQRPAPARYRRVQRTRLGYNAFSQAHAGQQPAGAEKAHSMFSGSMMERTSDHE